MSDFYYDQAMLDEATEMGMTIDEYIEYSQEQAEELEEIFGGLRDW